MKECKMAMVYESLWSITQQMLNAAENSSWDELLELEKRRSEMVNRIKKGLPDSEIECVVDRNAWIQRILTADTRITQLTEAWMDEIQSLLKSVRSERKLIHAYGTSAPRF
jgi:flagellar protein FliT